MRVSISRWISVTWYVEYYRFDESIPFGVDLVCKYLFITG